MKNLKMLVVILAVTCGMLTCANQEKKSEGPVTPTEKIVLFNGSDLSGWVFACRDSSITDIAHSWSVSNGVIQCNGDPFGYIRTDKPYKNYKLHAEWRWVTDNVPEGANRNSGFLLHTDDSNRVWPPFFECQLHSGNAGDLVLLGGMDCNELKELREQNIREAGDDPDKLARAKRTLVVPRKHETGEKSLGEWNMADITMQDNTSIVWINGVEQNRATGISASSGHICLQSEGAPLEFRNVYIAPIN